MQQLDAADDEGRDDEEEEGRTTNNTCFHPIVVHNSALFLSVLKSFSSSNVIPLFTNSRVAPSPPQPPRLLLSPYSRHPALSLKSV